MPSGANVFFQFVRSEHDLFCKGDKPLTVVVDADEDAQNIRLEIQGVGLPPVAEIVHGVAADTPVDEVEIQFGKSGAMLGGENEHEVVTEDEVWVGVAPALHVGDGIALKEDAAVGF